MIEIKIGLLLVPSTNLDLLKEFLEQKYDLHIVDNLLEEYETLDMLIIDGVNLKKEMQNIRYIHDKIKPLYFPVLFLTSVRTLKIQKLRIWEYVSDVVLKPVKKIELLARIESLLTIRRLSLQALHHKSLSQLVQEKEQIEELFEAIPEPIFLTDTGGNILKVNRAAKHTFQQLADGTSFLQHRSKQFVDERKKALATAIKDYNEVTIRESWNEREYIVTFAPLKVQEYYFTVIRVKDITSLVLVSKFQEIRNLLYKYLLENQTFEDFLDYSARLLAELLNCRIITEPKEEKWAEYIVRKCEQQQTTILNVDEELRLLLPKELANMQYVLFFEEKLTIKPIQSLRYFFFLTSKPVEEYSVLTSDLVKNHVLMLLYSHSYNQNVILQEKMMVSYKRIMMLVDKVGNNLATIQVAAHKCEQTSTKTINNAVRQVDEFLEYVKQSWKEIEEIQQ